MVQVYYNTFVMHSVVNMISLKKTLTYSIQQILLKMIQCIILSSHRLILKKELTPIRKKI